MDERNDGYISYDEYKRPRPHWTLHEEDGKCLILKISASGKNEDITC